MTDPVTAEAVRRLRERIGFLVELVADEPGNDRWADVLLNEVSFAVEEGPAAYLRYVQRMDDAAVRQMLDQELDRVRF